MQKTRKSVAKRFKITGSGKLLRRSPGQRHMMSSKSVKQKRRNGKDKLVAPGIGKALMKTLPSGVAR
jgi:large subunit ribosomal protein L35